MGMFDATRKFLTSQFQMWIPVWTQVFTLILHIFLCWLLTWHYELNETGAAIATNITYVLNMVICDICCTRHETIKKSYTLPTMEVFEDVGEYLKIGISGMLMLCFEWWAFELLAIFSGLLSVEALAAEVVVINLVTFIFMIPLGISYSASALTGYFIGKNDLERAKKYGTLTLLFNQLITIVIVIILGTFNNGISRIFTTE